MVPRMIAFLVLLTLGSQAGGQPSSSPKLGSLFLRGDTRACHGFLKLDRRHLLWRSSFNSCNSRYRVAGDQGGLWTLELMGPNGTRSRGCSLKAVTLQRSGTASADAVWQVAGYTTFAAIDTEPPRPAIACELQAEKALPGQSIGPPMPTISSHAVRH